jgi:hypothetical protein
MTALDLLYALGAIDDDGQLTQPLVLQETNINDN